MPKPLHRRFGGGSTTAVVEPVPNIIGYVSVIVEGNSPGIIPVDLHRLWFPTIVPAPVQIQVTGLMQTWPGYLIRVYRAPLERACRWII